MDYYSFNFLLVPLDWYDHARIYWVFVHACVYKQAMQRGSISHRWRKWGNLGPGVKEVMDFNAAIVVNGSLN